MPRRRTGQDETGYAAPLLSAPCSLVRVCSLMFYVMSMYLCVSICVYVFALYVLYKHFGPSVAVEIKIVHCSCNFDMFV